jgi:peroxiredoxin
MKQRCKSIGWVLWIVGLLAVGCGPADTPPAAPAAAPRREPIDVTFQIGNVPDGPAKVIGMIGSTNYLVDSSLIHDGTVHLRRDTALPSGLYYLVVPGDILFQFLLDQDQQFTFTADAQAPITSVKLDGSFDNELLYQNLVWEQGFQPRIAQVEAQLRATPATDPNWEVLRQQLDQLVQERKQHIQTYQVKHPEMFFTQYKLAGQNPDLRDIRLPEGGYDEAQRLYHYRKAFWDNTPLADTRLLRTPIIHGKLVTYLTQLTPQVHDSVVKYADLLIEKTRVQRDVFKFVVNWIAIHYHEPQEMGMESVFVHVVDKYFTDQDAFWATPEELRDIRKEVEEMRPSLVGKVGQDLTCQNLHGAQESLYDLRGRATILFIWNYECEHCQEQAPGMRKLYDRYHWRGLEIFSLCTGTDEAAWRAFIQRYRIDPFHNVFDPQYASDYYRKYHVDVTPECYVMDAQHKIVCKDLKPDQLPVVLDALLQ